MNCLNCRTRPVALDGYDSEPTKGQHPRPSNYCERCTDSLRIGSNHTHEYTARDGSTWQQEQTLWPTVDPATDQITGYQCAGATCTHTEET